MLLSLCIGFTRQYKAWNRHFDQFCHYDSASPFFLHSWYFSSASSIFFTQYLFKLFFPLVIFNCNSKIVVFVFPIKWYKLNALNTHHSQFINTCVYHFWCIKCTRVKKRNWIWFWNESNLQWKLIIFEFLRAAECLAI